MKKRPQKKIKRRHPLNPTVISSRRNRTIRNKRRKAQKKKVLGKDVSVAQSASPGQVVYGTVRTGGVYTFLETSSDSRAYLVTGSNNSQVAYQARAGGTSGNNITIEYTVSGTNANNIVTVVGNAISVRLKSSGGSSTATATSVKNSIQGNALSNALVTCNLSSGDGTGTVTALSPTALSGGGGTWLHHFITLACHQIDSVQKLYLDDREVTLGNSFDPRWGTGIWNLKVFMAVQLGAAGQAAQPDLVAQRPDKWTTSHVQADCAGAYIITVFNQNLFAEGFPEADFLIKGKPVYDPRSGLTVWSDNAALIIADYLSNTKFGLGVAYADIDATQLTTAADICDELTNTRYRINGYFDADRPPGEILEEMAAAIAGDIVYQGGKWFIYPGKWRASSMDLSESDLRGPMQVTTEVSRSDIFNSVRGTFPNAADKYNETDYPVVSDPLGITEDGETIFEDLSFSLVTSSAQCVQNAKIELNRVRQGITVTFPMSVAGLQLQVCDTVRLTNTRLGWSLKAFEVRDVTLEEDDTGVIICILLLRETSSTIFDSYQLPMDPAPNTTLPAVSDVDEPTNLTLTSGTSELYFRNDGTVFSRLKVSWDLNSSIYVVEGGLIEIQFKPSAKAEWAQTFFIAGDQTYHHILDVQDGTSYDVRARARNALGYYSDWVQVLNHIVVGKTAPPSNVTGFVATATDLGITMSWTRISDIDSAGYELRYGATWAAGALIARIAADGSAYTWEQLTAGSYTIMIKAIDTSGNFSAVESSQVVNISGPSAVTGLTARSVSNSVLLDWQDSPASTLSVNKYEVYKGATFESAARLGIVFGTFFTYLESSGGDFTYWIIAIDVGENRSSEVSASLTVQPASNFYVVSDINPITSGTLVQKKFCVVGGTSDALLETAGDLFFPVGKRVKGAPMLSPPGWEDVVETWDQWFDDNGFTTLDSAIAAGYDVPLSPNPHWPGYVEYKKDFGVTLGNTFINFSWLTELFQETPESLITITPTISTSPDDAVYTTYEGTSQLFATNFRYVKFRLDFQATDDKVLARVSSVRALLNVQEEEESGETAVLAADSGGTTVTFTKDFLYVTSIQLTASGTIFANPVYDFAGGANPTSFKILLFDEDGNRMDGTVGWTIKGPLNP